MTALHRSRAFLRSYAFLPHRLMNRGLARVTAATRPSWAVDRAIAAWARRDGIDLSDFEARRFESLDDFFLRRLRPGARPIGEGFVSPADGNVVGAGTLRRDRPLCIKGQRLSLERVVNAGVHDLDLSDYDGGSYAVVFLTPRGYHRVHMPIDGEVVDVRWIPGRYFPQNEDALQHIPRVYERNERAVLRCRAHAGFEFLLVMVGASLIGGIHLRAARVDAWRHAGATQLSARARKGEEIGHFAFGSTVAVLLPRGVAMPAKLGAEVRMGQTLLNLVSVPSADPGPTLPGS